MCGVFVLRLQDVSVLYAEAGPAAGVDRGLGGHGGQQRVSAHRGQGLIQQEAQLAPLPLEVQSAQVPQAGHPVREAGDPVGKVQRRGKVKVLGAAHRGELDGRLGLQVGRQRRQLPVLGVGVGVGRALLVQVALRQVVMLGARGVRLALGYVLHLVVGLRARVGEVLLGAGLVLDVGGHQVGLVESRGGVVGQAVQASLHLQLLGEKDESSGQREGHSWGRLPLAAENLGAFLF